MKTVLVTGIFNVLHPGHVRLLKFARDRGDRLLVGVLSDEAAASAATISEEIRLESVQSLRFVDEAFIVDDSVNEVVRRLKPSVVVKGREHAHAANEEAEELEAYGGRLIFGSGDSFLHAVDITGNTFLSDELLTISLPRKFMAHHGITIRRLADIVEAVADVRVLVVGDAIVDEYISCQPVGMSREDPTLVVKPIDTKQFIGGAAIVAAHAASLGADSSFHSVRGMDSPGNFLVRELQRLKVDGRVLTDESRCTTTKVRWRANGKTLLRVSTFDQAPIPDAIQQSIYESIQSQITDFDALIFSDFNYGTLPQSLVERIAQLGTQYGIIMSADSQTSSQIGDVSRFKGMNLLTPTEYEARVATHNFEDGLVVLADSLRFKTGCDLVLMTLAEDGVFVRGLGAQSTSAATERLEALNRQPVDVAGAGDALLVMATMALATGATIYETTVLASLAAAVQVSTIGNDPISRTSLFGLLGA